MTLRQVWRDDRLAFEKLSGAKPSYLSLAVDDKVYKPWLPDTVIVNEKAGSSMQTVDKNNVMIRISPNGQITYGYRSNKLFGLLPNIFKFKPLHYFKPFFNF